MASFYKREIDTILWNIGTRDATLATVVRLMSRGYFGFKEVGLEAFPCQPRESIRAARCTHAKHRTAFGKTPFSTKILHHRIAMEKSARNGNNFLFIFKKALSSEKSHTFTRPAIQVWIFGVFWNFSPKVNITKRWSDCLFNGYRRRNCLWQSVGTHFMSRAGNAAEAFSKQQYYAFASTSMTRRFWFCPWWTTARKAARPDQTRNYSFHSTSPRKWKGEKFFRSPCCSVKTAGKDERKKVIQRARDVTAQVYFKWSTSNESVFRKFRNKKGQQKCNEV